MMRDFVNSTQSASVLSVGAQKPCPLCSEAMTVDGDLPCCEPCTDLSQRLNGPGGALFFAHDGDRSARITITYRHLRPSSRLTQLLERRARQTVRQLPGAGKLSLVFDRHETRGYQVEISLKLKGAFIETRSHAIDDSDEALASAARQALQELHARAHELRDMQKSRLRGWLQEITGLAASES